MAERWFVLPGCRGEGARRNMVGVKYIDLDVWTGTPQITGVARRQWRFDHADNRVVLIRARAATEAPLDELAAQPDVFELPAFDTVIRGAWYTRIRNFLNNSGLPTDWLVRGETTVGELVDELIEMMTLTKRFYRITHRSLTLNYDSPDDPIAPGDLADLAVAVTNLGWQLPNLPPNVTIGQVVEWGRNRGRIPASKRRN